VFAEFGTFFVMASHGRFSAAFLGSETHKVLAQSTVPVLVCR
jgi:nucleotide-binding universal stress UspA family protein